MFSQKSAGEFYQTGSVAAGSSHLVPPLRSPETKEGKTFTLEKLLITIKVSHVLRSKTSQNTNFKVNAARLLGKYPQVSRSSQKI